LLLSKDFISLPYPVQKMQQLLEWRRYGAQVLPVLCGIDWDDVKRMVAVCKLSAVAAADQARRLRDLSWAYILEELQECAIPEVRMPHSQRAALPMSNQHRHHRIMAI
jgi:hypothetical protein